MKAKRIILAITGASGVLYALEFVRLLKEVPCEIHGIISDAGVHVLKLERGIRPEEVPNITRWHGIDDFTAPVASGSAGFDAMVVLPCTMGSLAAIANGITRNLIHRAADVMLKERKKLILAVRETPLNRVHLTNMLTAHDAGAIICPPMPAFYYQPKNLQEMASQYAHRVADLLAVDLLGIKRWRLETMTTTSTNCHIPGEETELW